MSHTAPRRRLCRSRVMGGLLVACLAAGGAGVFRGVPAVAAQGQPPVAAEPPTFRAGVRLVDVDVFVTDGEGQFVRDLTADDFEVLEDGRPQEVRTLALIDIPVESAPEVPTGGVEPDVTSNRTPPGRTYVILFDSPSTYEFSPEAPRGGLAYTLYTKRIAQQFVEEFVAPGDYVAVVHTQGTFNDGQGFTTSRQRMLDAVDQYGRGVSGDLGEINGPEMVARHLQTYRTIEALSERLGAMSGRRKAILWMGGQLSFSPEAFPCPDPPDPRLLCAVSRSAPSIHAAYRDALRAASRNNVAIYPVDPLGTTTELGSREMERQGSLRAIANDTNAFAVVNTNNYAGQYRAIVRENSTYYVLGYAPAVEHRDGRFHSVQVRVKRPGLTVRARRGYQAPDAKAEARADAAPVPSSISAAAREALRLPIPVTGLSLDLFTAPFKGVGREQVVVIGGQITGDLRLEGNVPLVLSYQVFATDGTLQTGEFKEFTLNLRPETRETVEHTGMRFVDRIALQPGRYELRMVADQPGGAVGSVIAHIDVPEFDERLSLSGIALGASSTAEHRTLRQDEAFARLLGAAPTAVREFLVGDRLTAFVEVYSSQQQIAADEVTLSAVLAAADGSEVARESGWPVEGLLEDAGLEGRWPFAIDLDLVGLPPGAYILTVEASATGIDEPVRRRIPVRVIGGN
jgi:VWFA-related protein